MGTTRTNKARVGLVAALGLVVATGTGGCLLPSLDSSAYGGQDASQNPGNGGSNNGDSQNSGNGSDDAGLDDTGNGGGGDDTGGGGDDTGNGGGDDTGGGGGDDGGGGGSGPGWQDVQTIVDGNCGGGSCHGSSSIGPGNFKFEKGSSESEFKSAVKPIVEPGNASNSLLYTQVESGDMPKQAEKLDSAKITTIKEWINGLSSL